MEEGLARERGPARLLAVPAAAKRVVERLALDRKFDFGAQASCVVDFCFCHCVRWAAGSKKLGELFLWGDVLLLRGLLYFFTLLQIHLQREQDLENETRRARMRPSATSNMGAVKT